MVDALSVCMDESEIDVQEIDSSLGISVAGFVFECEECNSRSVIEGGVSEKASVTSKVAMENEDFDEDEEDEDIEVEKEVVRRFLLLNDTTAECPECGTIWEVEVEDVDDVYYSEVNTLENDVWVTCSHCGEVNSVEGGRLDGRVFECEGCGRASRLQVNNR